MRQRLPHDTAEIFPAAIIIIRCRGTRAQGSAEATARALETLRDFVRSDTGPPRFFSPRLPLQAERGAAATPLPLLLYLPGIDGTGQAAARQFDSLSELFELRCLAWPPASRPSLEDLTGAVEAQLSLEPEDRPVYLLGESMGGALALASYLRCAARVNAVILVNPATSFDRSVWPVAAPLLTALPRELYGAAPYLLAPLLLSPQRVADVAAGAMCDPALASPRPAAAAHQAMQYTAASGAALFFRAAPPYLLRPDSAAGAARSGEGLRSGA